VLDVLVDILQQNLYDLFLFRAAFLGHPNYLLHHAEPTLIESQIFEMLANCVENLLTNSLRVSCDNLVDHVMALLVLGQNGDVVSLRDGLLNNPVFLLLVGTFQYVLESPSASLIAGDLYESLAFDLLQEVDALVRLQVADEF